MMIKTKLICSLCFAEKGISRANQFTVESYARHMREEHGKTI